MIQELKKLWEDKIKESKATDHPTVAPQNNATTTSNSKSNNSKKSAAAAAAAAVAAANAASNPSAAGGQTSVITSNPNHVKNGPPNSGAARIKDELQNEDINRRSTSLPTLQSTTVNQPQTTSVVQSSSTSTQMGVSNGTQAGILMQQSAQQSSGNPLAQPITPANILRASAIVSNPSGPSSIPAGMSGSPNLIQVQQQLSKNGMNPMGTSTSTSNRPTIVTLIPSSSSSFSPVIVSSASGVSGSSLPSATNSTSLAMGTPRLITSAPHGHKKRILSSAFADRNVANALNGIGANNLTNVEQAALNNHILSLASFGQPNRSLVGSAGATSTANILSAAAGLQQLSAANNMGAIISSSGTGSATAVRSNVHSNKQV